MKLIGFLLLCYIPLGLYSQTSPLLGPQDTFFAYSSQDLEMIQSLPLPHEELTQKKFEQWDSLIYELTSKPLPNGLSTCLMAYLYAAQRDFALLSYHTSRQWLGNPDSLIIKVLQLAFPDLQPSEPIQDDIYSLKISELVFRKIEERFKQEQAQLKDYPELIGPQYWKEKPPYLGQKLGSAKLWLLSSLKEVQAAPAPDFNSIIWAYGLNQIRFTQAHLTPEMRQLISFWAGEEGPASGNWFAIVNQDLQKRTLSLPEFLFVRTIFAMSYTDSLIAVFDAKYTYWVMRPHMRDPNIVEIINCPKHPSYPSAHSTTSSAAATLLSHFFPNEKEKWQKIAFEAGNSRIWAGIHYMYDNEQGLIQGEKVAREIIKRLPAQEQ